MSSELERAAESLCDPLDFCRACGRFPTGVTVLTTVDEQGTPHGVTMNSFTSVSLDPLMFLVCIDHRSRLRTVLMHGRAVAVNILAEEQQPVSRNFAKGGDFHAVEWTRGSLGAPLIDGTLATIEGVVREVIVAGDHAILLIAVTATNYREGRPLVFYNSRYQQLAEPAS